ncbi:MAG TPA: helix-turn-helix transcriptional regulator, partial [Candidatus Fimicola cottocaccae]|uniref:helix-turn-helix domain-containing protein n=1 Tax=Tyzzerella sp. An114 TaxID=1965545 RepID=UPI0013028915|nr:helix-turn-helix transcriptional regulator [Tyzzerella sp. An114]HIT73585.1 helix-turn-helix transcriptional regulator [Candidatus Fimicola cottocaccae]
MEFKERLKQLRKENNCTAYKLAKYLNYGASAISNYENGRNEPSIDVLIKISKFFDVSIDYLVGKSNVKNFEYLKNFKYYNFFSQFTDEQINKMIDVMIYMKSKSYL